VLYQRRLEICSAARWYVGFRKNIGLFATYLTGGGEIGALHGASVHIDGMKVVGPRAAAIADPAGGAIIDAEARGSIGQILTALRRHGLIET